MRRRLLWIGLVCLTASCHPAVSLRPLDGRGNCVNDPRVEGEWISPELDTGDEETATVYSSWTVTRESARYGVDVRAVPEEGGNEVATRYDVCLVALADALFFDADFDGVSDPELTREGLPLGVAPVHVIGRLVIEPDFLVLRFLDSDWVETNTPEGFRELIPNRWADFAVITGSEAELQELLKQHGDDDEAFALARYLCRPDADCPSLMHEYLLRHAPPETSAEFQDLLEEASAHSMRTGNYGRATELLRRSSDVSPDDPSRRNRLGTALLLARDYDGARREFSHVHHTHPGDEEAAEGIGWSYFLEGRFDRAASAFEATMKSAARTSVDPALLAYVALRRAGKGREADSLLTEELKAFSGDAEGHLLLLLFAGRIDSYPRQMTETAAARSRIGFFSAELLLAEGNADAARFDLWECLTRGGSDSVYALAARLELERMSIPPGTAGDEP